MKKVSVAVTQALGNWTAKFEVATLCFVIFALAVLLIANVIAREFFQSLYFAEEISQFLVIFITFVGLSYGVRKGSHIRMAAVFDLMKEKTKKLLILITSAVSTLLMFFMGYQAIIYVLKAYSLAQVTPALRAPQWIFIAIVPVGFFFAGIQYILMFIKNTSTKEVWISPEVKSEYEGY